MRSLTSSSSCSSATDKVFPFPSALRFSLLHFLKLDPRSGPLFPVRTTETLVSASARPLIHFTHERGHSTTSGTYDSRMPGDEAGLLGDLPRRRPGNRS